MTTSPPTAAAAARVDTPRAAVDRALAQVFDTVRANIEAFGIRYPDDTTRANRYPLRPAVPGFAEGRTAAGRPASGPACSGSRGS